MNYTEIEANAKQWLLDMVAKERDYVDFKITNVNDVNFRTYRDGILFKFQCKYTWTLNGWQKNVDTEIYVLYDKETENFLSPMF